MLALLKALTRAGLRKGLLGGSRPWLWVWVFAGLAARNRKQAKAPPKLLHREVLTRGESVRISVTDPRGTLGAGESRPA